MKRKTYKVHYSELGHLCFQLISRQLKYQICISKNSPNFVTILMNWTSRWSRFFWENPCINIRLYMLYWYAIYKAIASQLHIRPNNIHNHIDEQVVSLWLWYTDTQLQTKSLSSILRHEKDMHIHIRYTSCDAQKYGKSL